MIWRSFVRVSDLQAYGQRDPVVEYKMSAFEMFNNMISSIQEDTVRMLYHVHVEQKIEREQVAKVTGTNKDDTSVKKPVQRKEDQGLSERSVSVRKRQEVQTVLWT